MESLPRTQSTMQIIQESIAGTASSVSDSVISFTQNTMMPFLQNIWNAVKDIFSSLCIIVQSNPKTVIGITASLVTALAVSLAFLILKKEEADPKTDLAQL